MKMSIQKEATSRMPEFKFTTILKPRCYQLLYILEDLYWAYCVIQTNSSEYPQH